MAADWRDEYTERFLALVERLKDKGVTAEAAAEVAADFMDSLLGRDPLFGEGTVDGQ